jgi:YjbE family integral membrane protein
MDITTAAFWAALGSIILANILLSGDNAVVIALAARSLPPQQQKKAIFWGSAAAIVMRVVLTIIALEMLKWPYLKIIGGLLLLYIGVTLLLEEEDENGGESHSSAGMLVAIRTILVADLVMSLDNVIAVAAAAKGDIPLLIIGLGISIPLIIFGSTLLLKVMDRFPIIITAGAALLGYLAGEMVLTDPAVSRWFGEASHTVVNIAGAIGAAIVVVTGLALQRRARARATGHDKTEQEARLPARH